MANITFTVSDNPITLPSTAGGSKIAGCYSRSGLHLLASKEELAQGYIIENSGPNWYERVRTLSQRTSGATTGNVNYTAIINNGAAGGSGGAIQLLQKKDAGFVLAALAGSSGATTTIPDNFQDQWWSVYNYLQYGNTVKIGIQNGNGFTGQLGPLGAVGQVSPFPVTSPTATGGFQFYGTSSLDVLFQIQHSSGVSNGWEGNTYTSPISVQDVVDITEILEDSESPTIGVVNIGLTGTIVSSAELGLPTSSSHTFYITGRKKHLTIDETYLTTLTTHLAPDVAGMLVSGDFWQSPAGTIRGRVLNVVSLETNISPTQQAVLDTDHVNYCKTINGVGTILLQDDISNSDDDIRISRTIDNIKINLIPYAYTALFEINNEITRNTFRQDAMVVLNNLITKGAITTYTLTCDDTNNTEESIEAGKFIADVTIRFGTIIREIILSVTKGLDPDPV